MSSRLKVYIVWTYGKKWLLSFISIIPSLFIQWIWGDGYPLALQKTIPRWPKSNDVFVGSSTHFGATVSKLWNMNLLKHYCSLSHQRACTLWKMIQFVINTLRKHVIKWQMNLVRFLSCNECVKLNAIFDKPQFWHLSRYLSKKS